MVKGKRRAEKKGSRTDENPLDTVSCSTNTMTLSRKLRKKLDEAEDQTVGENVKRRKRNCRTHATVDTSTESQATDDVDGNQNNIGSNGKPLKSSFMMKKMLKETIDPGEKIDALSRTDLDPFQRELIISGLVERDTMPHIKGSDQCARRSRNMLHYLQQCTFGKRCTLHLRKVSNI